MRRHFWHAWSWHRFGIGFMVESYPDPAVDGVHVVVNAGFLWLSYMSSRPRAVPA